MKSNDLAFIDALRKRKSASSAPKTPVGSLRERTVFVVDRSFSMNEFDYPPTRLKAAVRAVEEYVTVKINTAPDDYAGMVIFNGSADVLSAGCYMRDAELFFLNALKMINPDNGTDIAKGLKLAGSLFPSISDGIQNRIVLLTDGHGGSPEKVADLLKSRGVVIDVIGIGGSPSDVNEKCLKKVASRINGQLRYRFIGDKDLLVEHFRHIAGALVRS